MRKEESTPQSKWQKTVRLQSKSQNSNDYKVRGVGSGLEQLINRADPAPISIPLSVLATEVSPATAIAHYLKNQHQLSYAEIARALNRDHRTIWTLLNRNALSAPPLENATHTLPLALFQNRTLSVLENTVKHLRAQGHTLNAIAKLLKKHPSTISTANQRARRKLR